MAFMEFPRFPTDINYSVVGSPTYKTQIVTKNSGVENANAVWPEGRHEYDVVYAVKDHKTIEVLLHFYHAIKGRFHQFRFKDFADYKSSIVTAPISACDQRMQGEVDGASATFQLIKKYDQGGFTTTRTIRKPVKDTVMVAIGGVLINRIDYSVDTTSGQVTFNTGDSNTITDISNSNPCVITADNILTPGNTIHISGVEGMAELNTHRYRVLSRTATTITIDMDSSEFGVYTTGGQFATLPQVGEKVTAGFEFDVPVRFADDKLPISIDSPNTMSVQSLPLVEVRL